MGLSIVEGFYKTVSDGIGGSHVTVSLVKGEAIFGERVFKMFDNGSLDRINV